MLTPSIGFCLMPSTYSGAWIPVASRIVGTMSMMWWNWVRIPPGSSMCPGHEIARPCRVPPKCDAICLVHLNGVSKAHDSRSHGYPGAGVRRWHQAEADRRREHGVHLQEGERQCAHDPSHPVLRDDQQPRYLPGRLVRLHDATARAVDLERAPDRKSVVE